MDLAQLERLQGKAGIAVWAEHGQACVLGIHGWEAKFGLRVRIHRSSFRRRQPTQVLVSISDASTRRQPHSWQC